MTDKNTSKNRPLMTRQRERSDRKVGQGKQSAICSRPPVTREPAKKQEGHDGWQNNGQQQEWENPQQHHGKQQLQQHQTAVEVVLPTPIAIQGEEPVEDRRDKALRKLAESQARQKKAYDLRHKDVTYKIGDFVMVEDLTPIPRLTSKLRAPYKGPGKVIGISADWLNCTCEFVDVNRKKKQVTHHVSHLKRYEMRHPLRMTIRKTVDGHATQPSVQQVVAEVGKSTLQPGNGILLGPDPILAKIKEWEAKMANRNH